MHKFLMPGSYRVFLSRGGYTCFHFWNWPSLRLAASHQRIKVVILNSNNENVPQGVEEKTPTNNYGGNVGRIEGDVKIEAEGFYQISCKESGVLVLVPEDSYDDFFFGYFPGCMDDLNFEAPR